MLTLHAAGGVDTDVRRRVFSARYLGDDIAFRAAFMENVT